MSVQATVLFTDPHMALMITMVWALALAMVPFKLVCVQTAHNAAYLGILSPQVQGGGGVIAHLPHPK